MRIAPGIIIIACFSLTGGSVSAQQNPSAATTTLQSSFNAQQGSVLLQDVTLNGSAEYIAGSLDETVSFTGEAISTGASRTDINLAEGILTEIRLNGLGTQTGTWAKGGSFPSSLAGQNLMTDYAWFFPAFVVNRLLTGPGLTVTQVNDDSGFIHFQTVQQVPSGATDSASAFQQHLSQTDLYLDPNTLLPVKLLFNVHPDNNALADIPVEVDFSNYQTVNGVTIPMQVQKFVNGGLALNIQIQTASFNSGLTASSISAQ